MGHGKADQWLRLFLLLAFCVRYTHLLKAALTAGQNGHTHSSGELLMFLILAFPIAILFDNDPIPVEKLQQYPLSRSHLALYAAGSRLFSPQNCLITLSIVISLAYFLFLPHPFLYCLNAIVWLSFVPAFFAGIALLLEFPLGRYAVFTTAGLSSWRIWHAQPGYDHLIPALTKYIVEPSWKATWPLLILDIFTGAAIIWLIQRRTQHTKPLVTRHLRLIHIVNIGGKCGRLIQKDVAYFLRLLDVQTGFALAMLLGYAVAAAPWLTLHKGTVLLGIIVFFDIALVCNPFALDGKSGMERYQLLPITGKGIILSKNISVMIIALLQAVPILAMGYWRLGSFDGSVLMLHWMIFIVAYLAIGNMFVGTKTSLLISMRFFRFASGGDLPWILGAVFAATVSVIGQILFLEHYIQSALLTALLIFICWCIFYLFCLRLAQRRLREVFLFAFD
ncbi:MAG TPA: hypothetical protein VFK06_00725 [Candidatus Angelobacter sp.]|nr:hypothetical protein [Candidatus Angelobacter sp.]